jgi:hypothetical protein
MHRIDASTLGITDANSAISLYAKQWRLLELLFKERPSISRIGPDECSSCPARKRAETIQTKEPLCMMDAFMSLNFDPDGKAFVDPTLLDTANHENTPIVPQPEE